MLTHPRRFVAACASVLLVLGLVGWTSSPSHAAEGDGTITGTVTRPDGTTIGGIRVTIFRQAGDVWEPIELEVRSFYDPYGESPSQVGKYTATLAPGTYKVGFNLPTVYQSGPDMFAPEYFNEGATLEDAEPITITAGSTRTAVNAQLNYTGGAISGTVTDIEGTPEAFAEVHGYEATTEFEDGLSVIQRGTRFTTYTDELGRYTLRTRGLPMKVRFFQDTGGYIPEYFDNVAAWVDAPFLSAPAGTDLPDTNAVLDPAPLVNHTGPVAKGNFYVGGTVRAFPGEWSSRSATYTYEWLRDGRLIGTGPTHKITSYSLGKSLRVRATAHQPGTPDVQATGPLSAKVKRASYLNLYASSPAKITAKFTVTLTFTGVRYPSGTVRVSCGLWTKTISVYKGRGTGTLKPIPSGYRKCKAVYAGTSTVASDIAYRNFTVK